MIVLTRFFVSSVEYQAKEWSYVILKRHWILFLGSHHSTEKRILPVLTKQYTVVISQTRRDAFMYQEQQPLDLLLIDIGSIRFDLTRFCDDFREKAPNILYFFLLNKGMRLEQFPRANGYLRHPFTLRQLQHRLARILPQSPGDIVAWQGLQLDTDRHFLIWKSEQVPLTPKQAALTLAFLREPGSVLSRADLMQDVWGTNYLGDTRTLDVHVHWLRQAFERLQVPFVIETLRGQGYRLIILDETEDET